MRKLNTFLFALVVILCLFIQNCRSTNILMETSENLRTLDYQKADDTRGSKAIVVYYSSSGNTQKVASVIASELKCPLVFIDDIHDYKLDDYGLLVLGSPVYAGAPAGEIQEFLENDKLKKPDKCAVFFTWGAPVWGPIAAGYCLDYMKDSLKSECIGEFDCPGFHQILRTYPSHPSEEDLKKAADFARGLKDNY